VSALGEVVESVVDGKKKRNFGKSGFEIVCGAPMRLVAVAALTLGAEYEWLCAGFGLLWCGS